MLKRLKDYIKMSLYNLLVKPYISYFGSADKRELKHYFSICLIFKNEAAFLKEWLDYHIVVGVDHFYLYNNGSTDDYQNVLQPYIQDHLVTLIDFPYTNAQFKAYKDCFYRFRCETNWICFLDADEFICLKKKLTIADWLHKYDKYPAVNIQWLLFGTGGVLNHNYNKNVIEQYINCWEDFSPHGKCFVNTRYEIANFDTWYVHHHTYMLYPFFFTRITVPAINQFGYICTIDNTWGGGKRKASSASIQINHYFTKSWDIWYSKMHKSDVLFEKNPKREIEYFYKYETRCTSTDYTIFRFLIKLKLYQKIIDY